uniref:Uncharacterized protein n=1 Tax=Physcomitrium patens TaxID=3218 RepID=A0A7I4ESU7_PHYPA
MVRKPGASEAWQFDRSKPRMEAVAVKLLPSMVVAWLVRKLNCKSDTFFNPGCEEFTTTYIVCGTLFAGQSQAENLSNKEISTLLPIYSSSSLLFLMQGT